MSRVAGLFSLMMVIAAMGLHATDERAIEMGQAIGKIVRLESQYFSTGTELTQELYQADSILAVALDRYRTSEINDFLAGGDGGRIGEIASLAAQLPEPAEDDPAARMIAALSASEAVSGTARQFLDSYTAALLLNLEGRRALRMRLGITEVLTIASLPVTLDDLGLARADSTTIKTIAETAGEGSADVRGDEAYLFYSAMLDLDDLGGRFGNQQKAADLADRVMTGSVYAGLAGKLDSLPAMTVVFFGDSQTDNAHWSSPAHYPNIIAEVFRRINPSLTIVNAGIGGDTSTEGRARMDSDVLAVQPDVCFVLFGANDCAHWGSSQPVVSPDRYGQNIQSMVAQLKADGALPVLMSYPIIPAPEPNFGDPAAASLRRMNELQLATRNREWTGWIGLAEMFFPRDPGRMFTVDQLHFSPEAHVLMAGEILRYLAVEIDPDNPGALRQSRYDFNGDGEFDVADALALLAKASQDPQNPAYDIDEDGAWGAADVVRLLRMMIGSAPMLASEN